MRKRVIRKGAAAVIAALLIAAAIVMYGPVGIASEGDVETTSESTQPLSRKKPQVVRVVMTANGFSLPQSVHAGYITFRASTPDATGHALLGFRLRNGVTLSTMMSNFKQAVSQDPATAAVGTRAVNRDGVHVGGPVVDPLTPVSVTVPLTAGTYYFFDFYELFAPEQNVNVHTVTVYGPFTGEQPEYGATIVATMVDGVPRFRAPDHWDTHETFLFINDSDEIHEASVSRVKPGTTDQDVQAFLDGVGPDPYLEHAIRGVGGISPGRSALLHFDLPRGPYVLQCMVADETTGVSHAVEGMHRVVHIDD